MTEQNVDGRFRFVTGPGVFCAIIFASPWSYLLLKEQINLDLIYKIAGQSFGLAVLTWSIIAIALSLCVSSIICYLFNLKKFRKPPNKKLFFKSVFYVTFFCALVSAVIFLFLNGFSPLKNSPDEVLDDKVQALAASSVKFDLNLSSMKAEMVDKPFELPSNLKLKTDQISDLTSDEVKEIAQALASHSTHNITSEYMTSSRIWNSNILKFKKTGVVYYLVWAHSGQLSNDVYGKYTFLLKASRSGFEVVKDRTIREDLEFGEHSGGLILMIIAAIFFPLLAIFMFSPVKKIINDSSVPLESQF